MDTKKQSSKKNLLIGIAVILAILIFCVVVFGENANERKYTYTDSSGEKSTFVVDFEAGTYEYSGLNFEKTSLGLLFKSNTSLEKSGRITYIETTNGRKKYSFSGSWGYYFFLSEDEQTLSIALLSFKLEK